MTIGAPRSPIRISLFFRRRSLPYDRNANVLERARTAYFVSTLRSI